MPSGHHPFNNFLIDSLGGWRFLPCAAVIVEPEAFWGVGGHLQEVTVVPFFSTRGGWKNPSEASHGIR